nr:immunoglobulin light chain junction region [Macaca mulatta]MOV67837.1 immunoglobulin light chain junction region [Macaca mulatta]
DYYCYSSDNNSKCIF